MRLALLTICFLVCGLLSHSCKQDNSDSSKETGNAALDKLNVMIAKDSADHTLLYERAKLYYDNNYLDGAIEDLERAIELDSLQPGYYHLLSDSYMDYFKSKDALRTMEECVKLFPDRITCLLKLSETQLILKQYDESLQTCSNILELNSSNAEAYFMMGMNLRSVGDMARAKNAFRKSTEFDPELTDAWIILGQMFEDEGDPKALDYYEAAINVDRSNPVTWHSKAYYLQNTDRLSEALEIYREINRIDQNYTDAYLNAGILYLSMDSLEEAKDQFNILVSVKPQAFIGYYYRGLTQEYLGNFEEALEDYKTTLRLNASFEKASDALKALQSRIESN